jgi:hypothetical protein
LIVGISEKGDAWLAALIPAVAYKRRP